MQVRILHILIVCSLLFLASCKGDEGANAIPEGFKEEVMLKMTPVKDQGKSELCWTFAMLATIESEHLMWGDSVNLSTDYVARAFISEQALDYYRSGGKTTLSMRGVGPMLIRLICRYGVMPWDSYHAHGDVNYKVLLRKVQKMANLSMRLRRTETQFMQEVENLLDREIGTPAQHVYMLGAEYTKQEFAHSVCGEDEYEVLMSNEDRPLGTMLDPQLADDRYHEPALNISGDSLVSRIHRQLDTGHPVFWEGGPNDNHALCILGYGRDAQGQTFFICKNSWGDNDSTHGMAYLPERYVKQHTALVVTKKIKNHGMDN